MPYQIGVAPTRDFIEIEYSGDVSGDELLAAFYEALLVAQTAEVIRFLADCSTLTGGHTITDLFGIVTLLDEQGLHPDVKEAIVMPLSEALGVDVEFYETACRNRGLNVRIFRDHAAAVEWLRA